MAQGYLSNILWHFTGPTEIDSDPKEFLNKLQFINKHYFPSNNKLLFKSFSNKDRPLNFSFANNQPAYSTNDTFLKKEKVVYEPKGVCFCDIPINYIISHTEKYGCIGFGVKKSIARGIKGLNPVHYISVSEQNPPKSIKSFFDDCKSQNINIGKNTKKALKLNKYVKIPTCGEASYSEIEENSSEYFDRIYEEREWRSYNDIEIKITDVAAIVLPSVEIKKEIMNSKRGHAKIRKILNGPTLVITLKELLGK